MSPGQLWMLSHYLEHRAVEFFLKGELDLSHAHYRTADSIGDEAIQLERSEHKDNLYELQLTA